jgi:hypothetical protein
MDWNSINSGVVKGIAQAVVWATIIWGWQTAKAYKIRREIRNSFIGQKSSAWQPPNLFAIWIRNRSPWPVTIRGAGFVAGGSLYNCGYLGHKKPVYDDHILLKAQTDDRWGFPIEKLGRKLEGVWVEIEFDTVFGKTKVEKIELGGDVAQFFENQRVQTRATFNLPPFEESPLHPSLAGASRDLH